LTSVKFVLVYLHILICRENSYSKNYTECECSR